MNNNRYELNPALHRDMPENLFEEQGHILITFWNSKDRSFPCVCHYEVNNTDFTIDLSIMKNAWEIDMEDDLHYAIGRKFGKDFLSRKDLNLNIIGI